MEPWTGQSYVTLMERDPTKSMDLCGFMSNMLTCLSDNYYSFLSSRWRRCLHDSAGLLETHAPYPSNQRRDPMCLNLLTAGSKYLSSKTLTTAGTAANPIWSVASIDSIFEPALNDKSASSIDQFTALPYPGLSWSNAAAVATKNWEGRRKKGSIFCALTTIDF